MEKSKNEELTYCVLQACIDVNVQDFIICAGSRNSSFVEALRLETRVNIYYWPEERSAAFFALGRSRVTNKPVAVITTSGTAAAELFPAVMESYYSCDPLIVITADRPRAFRGSGAPQSVEQEKMFGFYTKTALDIANVDICDLSPWDRFGPAHINVCLSEPKNEPKFQGHKLKIENEHVPTIFKSTDLNGYNSKLDNFLGSVQHPIAIVNMLLEEDKESVAQFLLAAKMPVMLEGTSGLREDARLKPFSLKRTDKILEDAAANGYPIDGILRIGGVPTHRIWRDLEFLEDKVKVFGISHLPFSGLSWSRQVTQCNLAEFLSAYSLKQDFSSEDSLRWLEAQGTYEERLYSLFQNEPLAECSLIHSLSKIIPSNSSIYLGNSLPIREWDLAASREKRNWVLRASRGVNGIDGQISTFLGSCCPHRDNFGLFGDLTALYDMVGCWILPKVKAKSVNIVIINNGGGKIFDRMYSYKEMQNLHNLNFRPLAEMWGLEYALWYEVEDNATFKGNRLIEIVPDVAATARFWEIYEKIDQQSTLEVAEALR